ncbi:cyclophilin-like domain-containing protein [Globomyces pollinis-pini]|nr:cyclophilin-like domain-containing protein [Globomyces pollinis-pini]
MSPTAVTLQFGKLPSKTQPENKQIPFIQWLITGDAKSPEFQKVIQIANSAKAKYPNLVDVCITQKTPFEFAEWRNDMRNTYAEIVTATFPSCIIQANSNKLYRVPEFLKFAEVTYEIPNIESKQFEQIGHEALQVLLKDRKVAVISLEIHIDKLSAGVLTFELYRETCPISVERFLQYIEGYPPESVEQVSYEGAQCVNKVQNGWIQFAIPNYTPKSFDPDENYIIKHSTRGIISLVNQGPNTNASTFMITLKPMKYFDKKYMAIGRLVDGEHTLSLIEKVSTSYEKPDLNIQIGKIQVLQN